MSNLGGGLSFGRQWIFEKGLVLEIFLGGFYGDSKVKSSQGEEDPEELFKLEGLSAKVGFNLGFAF